VDLHRAGKLPAPATPTRIKIVTKKKKKGAAKKSKPAARRRATRR
jgi:hypothetical protein